MSIKINPAIFREYDVRGINEKDLSKGFAELMGRAFSKMLKERSAGKTKLTVSVGRDCRLTSDDYADALIHGMRCEGINVISLGVCPTPLTYFSIFQHHLDGGVMVTGSHNAADYNGFKICIGKDTIHGKDIQVLRKHVEEFAAQKSSNTAVGTIQTLEIIPEYIQYVVGNIPKLQKRKIVLDAGNGTASTVAPVLFEKLGAQVIPLYCELDGRFPNHHPDPTVPENLAEMRRIVLKEKADCGIAFDGDSDRIGLVDENGRVIFGDELLVILSRDILSRKPGATIISEVKSSHRLYDDIKKHGGNPIMWKTGHSLIKSKMKEVGAELAGEMSGHVFFADRYFGYDDAIYSGARLYEILSKTGRTVSELIEDLPKSFATPEIRIDCQEDKKFMLIEKTKEELSRRYDLNTIDGIRANFGQGWGLVRASNTQPALVLRFEAETEGQLNEYREIFLGALGKAADALKHPPLF